MGPGGRYCHGYAKRQNFERKRLQDLMMDWRMVGDTERKESKMICKVLSNQIDVGRLEEGQFEGMKRFVFSLILRCTLDNSSRDVP